MFILFAGLIALYMYIYHGRHGTIKINAYKYINLFLCKINYLDYSYYYAVEARPMTSTGTQTKLTAEEINGKFKLLEAQVKEIAEKKKINEDLKNLINKERGEREDVV